MPASTGESAAHRLLKLAALHWAREQGYRAVGLEVRLPHSPYRADVAACRLERPAGRPVEIGLSAVFEVKQSRPDYLHDSRPEAASRDRLAALNRRREKLERLVGLHYPNLRRGESLFPEYDQADWEAVGHGGYRRLMAEIRALESALFGRTKFERMVRYRCADLFYLVARPGIFTGAEVPHHWGVLEPEPADLEALGEAGTPPRLRERRQPRKVEPADHQRLELLHQIAVSGTGRLIRGAAPPPPSGGGFRTGGKK